MHLKSLQCIVLLILAILHGRGMAYPQNEYSRKNSGHLRAQGDDNWQEFDGKNDFKDYSDYGSEEKSYARHRGQRGGHASAQVRPRWSGDGGSSDELTDYGEFANYDEMGESSKVESPGELVYVNDGRDLGEPGNAGDFDDFSDMSEDGASDSTDRGFDEPREYGDIGNVKNWEFVSLQKPHDLESLRHYNDETERNDLRDLKDLGSVTDINNAEDGINDSNDYSDTQPLNKFNEQSESAGLKHKRLSAFNGGSALDRDIFLNGLTALINQRNSILKDLSGLNEGAAHVEAHVHEQQSSAREPRHPKDKYAGLSDYVVLDGDTHELAMDEMDAQPRRFVYADMPLVQESQLAEAMEQAVTPECEPEEGGEGQSGQAAASEPKPGKPAPAGAPKPPAKPGEHAPPGATAAPGHKSKPAASSGGASGGGGDKTQELHQLIQHLYIAQARVQMEASEIKKSQILANSAQADLEEAANHVRSITAALQNAQQEVAAAAIRAQTAQLQLAAHDQLLFAARQDVDALSSQMVGLTAAEGIAAPSVNFDVAALMNKLKQPLAENEKPTAIPPVCPLPKIGEGGLSRLLTNLHK